MANQRKTRRRKPASETAVKSKKTVKSIDVVKVSSPLRTILSKCFYLLLLALVLVIAIAGIGYCISPVTALPTTDYTQQVDLVGKFETNRKLTKGVRIPHLDGPEAIEEDENGNIYTGLQDGRIVCIAPTADGKIGQGRITNITNGIMSQFTHTSHGRPLGLRLMQNTLYVADAVYGIYSVNIKSNVVTPLLAPDDVTPRIGLADDLYVTKDEEFLYFTDVSSKFEYDDVISLMVAGLCDSRVLQYNIRTKETRTAVSNLCFGNGVQLSPDESLLYVTESMKHRVRLYDVKTWKLKQIIHLPMTPDNIRPTGKGTYWVAGGSPPHPWNGFFERNPWLRQILAGLLPLETIFKSLISDYNMIVEMSEDGEILQSLHDPNGELTRGLSHASTLSDGRVALGSFFADFLAILDIKNVALGTL